MPADRESRQTLRKGAAQAPMLDRDEIAIRAYCLYMDRGCADGHDVDDWVRAEQELAREKQHQADRQKLSKSEAA